MPWAEFHPEAGYGGHRSETRRGGLSRHTNLNSLNSYEAKDATAVSGKTHLSSAAASVPASVDCFICSAVLSGSSPESLLLVSLRTVDIAIDVPDRNR